MAPTQSLSWWTRLHEKVFKSTWACTPSTAQVLTGSRSSPTSAFYKAWGQQLPLFSLTFTPCSITHTHTHSLLPLHPMEPIPVKHSIFNQMLQSQSSSWTFSSHYFQILMWSNPSIALGDPSLYSHTVALWDHKDGPVEESATLQGPST